MSGVNPVIVYESELVRIVVAPVSPDRRQAISYPLAPEIDVYVILMVVLVAEILVIVPVPLGACTVSGSDKMQETAGEKM